MLAHRALYLLLQCMINFAVSHIIYDVTKIKSGNFDSTVVKETLATNDISMPFYATTVPKAIVENGVLKHLLLDTNGFNIKLNLIPVTNSLISTNITYIIRDDNKEILQNHPNFKQCHYRSTNLDVEAAISDCDGYYRGTIIFNGDMYSIQPVTESNRTNNIGDDDSVAHAIFKRSTSKTFCGSDSHSLHQEQRRLRDDPVPDDKDDDTDIVPTARLSKKADLTVEIGLFIDSELYKRYVDNYTYSSAEWKLQEFVTAVFNNIQLLYHHPTMTPRVNIKVVRYEIFKSQPVIEHFKKLTQNDLGDKLPTQTSLTLSYELSMEQISYGDAQTYLDAFCLYQYHMVERTWDHSFLLTGIDLVRNGNDKTISGISRLLGVCDSYNSCTLSEGFDFTSSFIGAHEIGHALGMKHDEPDCGSQYIMSNSLGPGKVSWSWCSIEGLKKYVDKLDYQGKNCMRQANFDTVSFELDGNVLPGQKFDADAQCALFHGPGFRQVKPVGDYPETVCYMTWCGLSKYGRILTSHPAIEGTYCDSGKYCLQGKCTPFSNSPGGPTIVDGSWSSWSSVSCPQCACPLIADSINVLKSTRTCTNPSPQNGGKDCTGDRVRGIVCSNNACKKPTRSIESYMKSICSNHKRVKNDVSELTGVGRQLTKSDSRACKVFCEIEWETNGHKNYRSFGDILPDGTSCGSGRYCVDGECLSLECYNNVAVINDRSSCPGGSEYCPIIPQADLWSDWSAWSVCSVTCGSGVQSRSRSCSGSSCSGSKDETSNCYLASCPSSDGEWSTWGDWTPCSTTCDSGSQAKYRTCKTGSCSGSNNEVRSCESASCTSAGVWTTWTTWSVCSKSCGSGVMTRSRSCSNSNCRGFGSESTSCNTQLCDNSVRTDDADAPHWSAWSQSGGCSVTCGTGTQTYSRYCTRGNCQGSTTKEQSCNGPECADWGGWSSWSDCGGERVARKRIRNCYGGTGSCVGSSFEEKGCSS